MDKFGNSRAKKDGKTSYCFPCANEAAKLYKLQNRENVRKRNAEYNERRKQKYGNTIKRSQKNWNLKKYGLTPETYQDLVLAQGNRCAICNIAPSEIKALAIDHCHSTQQVRGLLCSACNLGLGNFRDQTDLLVKAIKYLNKSRKTEHEQDI